MRSKRFGLLIAIIVGFIIFCCISSPSSDWNDGYCPKCDVRYVLQKSRRGWHTYVCPECNFKVVKYYFFGF